MLKKNQMGHFITDIHGVMMMMMMSFIYLISMHHMEMWLVFVNPLVSYQSLAVLFFFFLPQMISARR